MDAITLLKEDHATVKDLFSRYEETGPRALKTRKKLVDKIVEELSVHAYVEEEIFYPQAREAADEAEDTVLESFEEHHIVEWTLSELVDLDPSDERFDPKVNVLIELVREHIKEEERELFPQVRKALGRTELQELGERMEAAKSEAPRQPKPKSDVDASTTATPSREEGEPVRGGRQPSRVEEVMTPDPVTISAQSSIVEAARLMREADTGAMIVVDENDEIEGIVTDRDITIRAVAEDRDPSQTRIAEIVSGELATLEPGASVKDAVRLMREKAVRRLPVVDGGKAVGIVSIGDLAVERDPDSALADISGAPGNR